MIDCNDIKSLFPIGSSVKLTELERDPYPFYQSLREYEPVSYIESLDMYFVTRYEDIKQILRDTETYTVGAEKSMVYDTFGAQMLTTDGKLHDLYKSAHRPFFMPKIIRSTMENHIRRHVTDLIDGFANNKKIEIRQAFASRLPVLTMLSLFGISIEEENNVREWYDSFEAALSNFSRDEEVRVSAKKKVEKFRELIQGCLDKLREENSEKENSLLQLLLLPPELERLSDDEIIRNALIIFFGGISTVEALILNTLYALTLHPKTLKRVCDDPMLITEAITETGRWLSPVQSATRQVTKKTVLHGIELRKGDTVNCMLGSGNRDSEQFINPDCFDIERNNAHTHLGFSFGSHHCLGFRLARAEAQIALEHLFRRLPGFRLDISQTVEPKGYEFRQPHKAVAVWD